MPRPSLPKRTRRKRRWELDASIKEEREFTLTTDPHMCAFGKWYDTYKTEDLSAKAILRKFDRPHRRIHAIAHKVKEFQIAGDYENAAAVVKDAKGNELEVMIKIFANISQHMRDAAKEIVMIVETRAFDYALVIDMVKAVEFLAPGTTEKLPAGLDNGATNNLVGLIGRRQSDNSSVQILNANHICDPDEVKGLIQESEAVEQKELLPA